MLLALLADCFSMPHIAHAFVAAIAIPFFALLAGAFSLGEMEVRPGSELHCSGLHPCVPFVLMHIFMSMLCC
jgi:hypothetical protein